jgi:hypothetical protein
MLGVQGKGIAMHQRLRDDDDTSGIGIGNALGGNSCDRFYGIMNESWKWKVKPFLVTEWKRVQMKTKREKWIEYEYMFVFLNCWIFMLLYLLWYSRLNNMCFYFSIIASTTGVYPSFYSFLYLVLGGISLYFIILKIYITYFV